MAGAYGRPSRQTVGVDRPPALLDTLMPAFEVRDVHEVTVAAESDRVWTALHETSLREVPLFHLLMSARELPGRMVGRRWLTGDVDRPLIEQMTSVGFVALGGRPGADLALGLLTRPWLPGGGEPPVVDAASFMAFDEPGWAKVVLGFSATGAGGGTLLRTETRVHGTDPTARRWFRAYWVAVGWGSAATRRSWLAAIRHRAERPVAP